MPCTSVGPEVPETDKMSGRKVTMNDLFSEPDGGEAESASDKLKSKKLGGMNGKQQVHIQKAAVQGEFGAKKFIKP
ncbi:hypothetical protein N9L76_07855 [bacterium]|nr:hypothetical protein [bacterium]